MPLDDDLLRLENLKRRFTPQDAIRIERLLDSLAEASVTAPSSLIRLHEALLFIRAYPPNAAVRRKAEQLLSTFAQRVASLEDTDPLETPQVSGIAGTVFRGYLSYDVLRRLARRYPRRIDIDWDGYEISDRLAPLWRRLFPLVEDDSSVEAHVPYLDWLRAAMGRRGPSLAWLIERIDRLPLPEKERAELFDSLQLPTRWDLGNTRAARSRTTLPAGPTYFHTGALIPRRAVSLEAEFAAPPLRLTRVPPGVATRALDVALETSAVRYRELYGFTYGDVRHARRTSLGRGVEVYLYGLPPERRLPLRAYHCAMMFKNSVPVGYVETLTLFERMEVGFNVYYTFREGESAWLFAKILKVFHQILGVSCFSVDPYQIGHENEEAIESGAFWFYRKLGFRPVLPEVVRLCHAEEARIRKDPSRRTPARTLRRMAVGHLIYEIPGSSAGDWDRFHIRKVGLAAQKSYNGAGPVPRGFDAIPGLPLTKAELGRINRAKYGPDETAYVRLLQRLPRLRQAIIRLGSRK